MGTPKGGIVAPRYMSVPQAATYLGWSSGALYHRVARHAIPVIRVGRRVLLDREQLDAWLHRNAVPSK